MPPSDKSEKRSKDLDPENWVELYGDALFRYAMMRVKNRETAEDLVQETLLSAIKGIDSFAGKSSVRTWLVSILKHKVVDYFRKSGREMDFDDSENLEFVIEQAFKTNGHWVKGPSSWDLSPQKAMENKDFWRAFELCLGALPQKHARIFAMREVDGEPAEKICKDMGISSTNLWVMMHRARVSLRACLENTLLAGERGKDA